METLAELAGVAAASADTSGMERKVGVLVADQMTYRQAIKPSEAHLVELEAEITSMRRLGKATVKATRDSKVVAEGEVTFMLVDRSAFTPKS